MWILGLFLSFASCAEAPRSKSQTVQMAPAVAPTSPGKLEDESTILAKYLGWHVSTYCEFNSNPIAESIRFRLAEDHVDVLHADGDADRYDVHLTATKLGQWDEFGGNYEVGKALWMTDGFVIVQSPSLPPALQKEYADNKDLTPIYRRITFTQRPDSLAVLVAPVTDTGQHSQFGELECQLRPVPKEERANYDESLQEANGPTACKRAATCCDALRALDQGINDEGSRYVCNREPNVPARYCRSWQKQHVRDYQTSWGGSCQTDKDGQRWCSIGKPPDKPRPVPKGCEDPPQT